MTSQLVTVFGGSGFIGRHLVGQLANLGMRVRVAVRNPESALFLKPMGDVGQITPIQTNMRYPGSVFEALNGADKVVNLVGILYETRRQKFSEVHRDGAAYIAEAAKRAGVADLVHISALGASVEGPSQYAQSKARGEEVVLDAFPSASILRPSVIFGKFDRFFNRFASMARVLPFLPVIGCQPPRIEGGRFNLYGDGGPKFQPVYVGDVAAAVTKCLLFEETKGKIYELGGPKVYSFKELMELLLCEIGRQRILIPVPIWLAMLQAAVLEHLPHPIITCDQVKQLTCDNVVANGAYTFKTLGIFPTTSETILPTYLNRYRQSNKYK